MALRRPHRKSRHGCNECKRRRVKCDETRPICTNCSKRQAECEYDSASALLWTNEESKPPRSHKSGSEGSQPPEASTSSTANSFSVLGRLGEGNGAPHQLTDLNLGDLELMMQWCNSTYTTLSRGERTDPIWRCRVPEEALSHPFLMHGILAISALHIARTRRDDPCSPVYLSAAVAHQNRALTIFRESLADINATNAKAMFAFASVVVLYAFGYPHSEDTKEPWVCVDELIQVLVLSRGVQQVLNQAIPVIMDSDWGTVLKLDEYDYSLPENAQTALDRLLEVNKACGAQNPAHDIDAYSEAIGHLADMTAAVNSGLTTVTVACRWAIKIRAPYLDALRDQDPLALVILAHWCTILHRLRDIWYIGEWSVKVPRAIWQTLDENWRPLAQWPMEEIFGENYSVEMDTD